MLTTIRTIGSLAFGLMSLMGSAEAQAKCYQSEATTFYAVKKIIKKSAPVKEGFICKETVKMPCSDGSTMVITETIYKANHLDEIPTFCGGEEVSGFKVGVHSALDPDACALSIYETSYHLGVQSYSDHIEIQVPSNFADLLIEQIAGLRCVETISSLSSL